MPQFLLTNDDGIDAPGLAALFQAAAGLGERLVLAPDGPRSGCGHAVTTHDPIPFAGRRPGWFAVGGTPADCSRLGLTHLARDADWVLSGINRGGNLGADSYISGTVAAAREAAFLGKKGLAVSQYVRTDLEVDWGWTCEQAALVIRLLLARPLRPRSFWNVNLPHLPRGATSPSVVFCKLDTCPLDVRFRVMPTATAAGAAVFAGNYHGRERQSGRDVDVCFSGSIAVTEVPLEIMGD